MHRAAALVLVAALTSPLAAQTSRPGASPSAQVVLRIDSSTTARFTARGFDLRVGQASGASIQLVKTAGPATGDLLRLSGTASIIPEALIDVVDSVAAPVMKLRLTNVMIASDQVTLSTARTALEQQRIQQQESLSSLTSEFQEAQRQLTTLEELGKTRVATRQDIARARDRASDLRQRIELLNQRQALLSRQLDATGSVEETLVLHFENLEMEDVATGTRSTLHLGARQPRSKF